jgi:hypothetical protein
MIPPFKKRSPPFLKLEGASQQVKRLEKEQAACPPTPSRPALPTPHKAGLEKTRLKKKNQHSGFSVVF